MKLKRKPDLMVVLAIVVGLGVVASSIAQGMLRSPDTKAAQLVSSAYAAQAVVQTSNQTLNKKN
jgi:hypothetical protein